MSPSEKKPLGRILLEQKVIDKSKLDGYLERQKQTGGKLGSIIDQEMPEKHGSLLRALSVQHGVPAINLDEIVIKLSILRLVPKEVAVKNKVLPVLEKKEHLFLVMADPKNHSVVDEIEFVTGKKVFRYVTLERNLEEAITVCYRFHEAGEAYFRGRTVSDEKFAKVTGGKGAEAKAPPPPAEEPAGSTQERPSRPGEIRGDGLPAAEEIFQSDAVESTVPSVSLEEMEQYEEMDTTLDSDEIPIEVETSEQPKEPRILVVDDEEDILNLISKILTEHGYHVLTAMAGREALAVVKKEALDLIILDAMLPEIHGFDICKRIKGSSKYGTIPVIMISAIYRGWRFAKDLKESYGVDEFIEKPFKIQNLLKIIESMLQRKSAAPPAMKEEMSREAQNHLEASANAYRKGEMNEAVDHLKAALKIDPLSPKLHYNLALVYGKTGRVYYAISELESVLELEPTMFQAMKNLAILYQEAGFKNKAIEMWERALSICEDEESKKKMREHLVNLL